MFAWFLFLAGLVLCGGGLVDFGGVLRLVLWWCDSLAELAVDVFVLCGCGEDCFVVVGEGVFVRGALFVYGEVERGGLVVSVVRGLGYSEVLEGF